MFPRINKKKIEKKPSLYKLIIRAPVLIKFKEQNGYKELILKI